MSDPISLLLEAIEAREQKALKAAPGPWHANAEHDEVLAVDDETVCEGFALSNNQLRATVDFIVDNDPAAVLRHCKADRATVIQYELLRWRPDYTPGLGETLGVLRLIVERLAIAYGITEEER